MGLFVIGSSNIDLVIYLKRIPKIGETVIGGDFKNIRKAKELTKLFQLKKRVQKLNL